MKSTKQDQETKARLGAIGELNVVSMLMQRGWDAFNANVTIKNYKSVDIVCLKQIDGGDVRSNAFLPQLALVQVKTTTGTNIPVGFTLEQSIDKEYLNKMVMGPYVFVFATKVGETYSFRYFILSKNAFIDLLYKSHIYYVKEYKRDKELNPKSPAALNLKWLEGKSDQATEKHPAFINPLNGISCEDCWDNIWKP